MRKSGNESNNDWKKIKPKKIKSDGREFYNTDRISDNIYFSQNQSIFEIQFIHVWGTVNYFSATLT